LIGVKDVDAYTHLGQAEFSHSLSFDASGGSPSRNLLGAAEGALMRAAASTQPFGAVLYRTSEVKS
jgi:hypothetical protein